LKRSDIPSIGGLTSFVAAAQHGSFTRAAAALNLTQGAISRRIREIESHLGTRLFARVRQRVVLTDAGKLYLPHVKKALDDLADAAQRVASIPNSTVLNLVALPTFATRWLVPRLSDFQKENPAITVRVTTRQEPLDFDVAPFDAAVFHEASQWPGTMSHFLMAADFIAVCSPKLNARRAIKTPADVAKFPLLHKGGKSNRWSEWMALAGIAADGEPQGHAYENFSMIAQAAIAGLGIALLPHYLVEGDIAAKRLEIVACEFVQMKTSYYVILPEARASSSAVVAFVDWLVEEARLFSAGDDDRSASRRSAMRRPSGRQKMLFAAEAATRQRPAG
jgi:LysR family glycine cleavage system transcriptional activator